MTTSSQLFIRQRVFRFNRSMVRDEPTRTTLVYRVLPSGRKRLLYTFCDLESRRLGLVGVPPATIVDGENLGPMTPVRVTIRVGKP